MPKLKKHQTPNAAFYRDVLYCCIPLLAMSHVLYGPRPVILAGISCTMAYVCDRLLAPLHGPDYDPGELSSECFAVLLTLLMPANVSAYVLAFAVLSAVVVKEVFGGCGNYPFNPAAVAYAIVAVGWPEEIFRYPAVTKIPITGTGSLTLYESASATLQAGGLPNLSNMQLLVGNYSGPLGTGFTLILISCGFFLLNRNRIHLSTTLSFLVACGLVAWCLPRAGTANMPTLSLPWEYVPLRLNSLKFEMLSGAIIFTAVFLICEPVTQPRNTRSRINYGFALGLLSMMFRYYGAYETGVCFAILILNALSDRLDRVLDASANLVHEATVQTLRAAQSAADGSHLPGQPKRSAKGAAPAARPRQRQAQPKAAEQTAAIPKVLPGYEEYAGDETQELPALRRRRRSEEVTGHTLMIPNMKDVPTTKEVRRHGKQ